jgi:diadenylate cyclase
MASELSGGDGELQELEARQDPRLLRALDIVAPGTALREGIDNIVHSRTGGLIVIGDPEEVSFLFSGGLSLDVDYTPALLYQVAKMDGAIALNQQATQIVCANVQLMPDPTILSSETGTRHRTAERVSKQTDVLVVAISERRDVVSLYLGGMKYILQDIPAVLAKANQGLATLDKYRVRLDAVSSRLTVLEFEGGTVLYDVLSVLQRAELVTRMAVEVERYIVELGPEGRLIEMQLEETMVGVAADKAALIRDYSVEDTEENLATTLSQIARLPHQDLLDFGRLAELLGYDRKVSTLDIPVSPRGYRVLGGFRGCRSWWSSGSFRSSADSRRSSPRATRTSRPSKGWGRHGPRTSARASAGCRRSTRLIATCRAELPFHESKGETNSRAS